MPVLPDFGAARFEPGAPIDNPLFPLVPGTVYSYGGSDVDPETGESVAEHIDTFVTFEAKEIEGVTATVVRDTAYENGVLVEDTVDWYAQDTSGNVWYLGELTYAFEYDDAGNYVGTSTEGSWEAGVDGAQPGYIMRAEPGFGASYYQEFAPGVAEDEAIVVGVDQEVSIGLGAFDGVLQTLDTTALEPDQAEYKYYAPGVGLVLEQALDEEGGVEFAIELQGVRTVGDVAVPAAADNGEGITLDDLVEAGSIALPGDGEPDLREFQGDGSELFVTFLGESTVFDNAIGAYTIDESTGEFGEGRILFPATGDLDLGETIGVEVAEGEALGLFLVPDGADLGLDLSEFEGGGLFFTDFQTGEAATLDDGMAPLATDDASNVLPVPSFHALDGDPDDGLNFLNPAAGVQAIELGPDAAEDTAGGKVTVLGFEDLFTTDPAFDGDYDDAIVAVSEAPLGADTVASLLGEIDTAAGADSVAA
jgi:hypothetical protein